MASPFVADTATRVERATAPDVNERIERLTEAHILHYAQRLDDIERRLHELDEEWDIERALQANFAAAMLSTLTLSLFKRRWRVLTLIASGFLIVHALNGWCPPLAVWRRMGVRTTREQNRERFAIKALRGDFEVLESGVPMSPEEKTQKALSSVAHTSAPAEFNIPL